MTKTVLVADDSATMRTMVGLTLKSAGFEVITAVDGKDALAKSGGAKIDMVITDLNMPGMDGIALIKELRETPANRFTPIVMLTTESEVVGREKGKQAGASGWIFKPFSPSKLLETVNRLAR
ncbi:MAG: response regulator [Nitrospirota bacterium]|nr:response regulator [Nitrospirota bacterium]